jgi:hypothetical protein
MTTHQPGNIRELRSKIKRAREDHLELFSELGEVSSTIERVSIAAFGRPLPEQFFELPPSPVNCKELMNVVANAFHSGSALPLIQVFSLPLFMTIMTTTRDL